MYGSARAPCTETRTSRAVTRSLLIAEIALACTLLVGGSLLLRSFVKLATTDPGVRTDGVLMTWISLPAKAFPDRAARVIAVSTLEDAMRELPGVQHLALSTTQADFDAAKVRLEAAGIEFIGPDRGIDNSIYLRDPNGVNIEFYVQELGVFEGHELLGAR